MSRRDAAFRQEAGLPLGKDIGSVAAPPTVDAGEQIIRFTMGAAIAVPAPATTNYTPQVGDELKFIITQDATAGRALTWNSAYRGMPATGGSATSGQILACKAMWTGAKWTFIGGDATFA